MTEQADAGAKTPKAKTGGIPLSEFSGSGATDRLHQTICEFNERTTSQTETMLTLTKVIAVLTGVMLFAVLVQIYLAFYPPK